MITYIYNNSYTFFSALLSMEIKDIHTEATVKAALHSK